MTWCTLQAARCTLHARHLSVRVANEVHSVHLGSELSRSVQPKRLRGEVQINRNTTRYDRVCGFAQSDRIWQHSTRLALGNQHESAIFSTLWFTWESQTASKADCLRLAAHKGPIFKAEKGEQWPWEVWKNSFASSCRFSLPSRQKLKRQCLNQEFWQDLCNRKNCLPLVFLCPLRIAVETCSIDLVDPSRSESIRVDPRFSSTSQIEDPSLHRPHLKRLPRRRHPGDRNRPKRAKAIKNQQDQNTATWVTHVTRPKHVLAAEFSCETKATRN